MLRKSFRRGLGLGLLLGAAIAIYRTLEARRELAAPEPQPWTPVAPPPPEPPPEPAPRVQPPPVQPPPVQPPPVQPPPVQRPEPEPGPEPEPEPEQPVDEVGEPVPDVPPATAQDDDITPAKKPSPRRAARAAKKAPATKKAAPPAEPWIDPEGKICPPSHPVKGKLASKIFHVPGGFNYERTVPDRCYRDAGAAEADGLRQSKR